MRSNPWQQRHAGTAGVFVSAKCCPVPACALTLGAADEQIGQCEGAGENSYCSSVAKVLAGLAADPWALGGQRAIEVRRMLEHAGAAACRSSARCWAVKHIGDGTELRGSQQVLRLRIVQLGEVRIRVVSENVVGPTAPEHCVLLPCT